MISFQCSTCNAKVKSKKEFAGRKAKCPRCRTIIAVPEPPILAALVKEPPLSRIIIKNTWKAIIKSVKFTTQNTFYILGVVISLLNVIAIILGSIPIVVLESIVYGGTKKPKNSCRVCGYTWYPRGRNVSLQCPKCKDTDVRTFQTSIVLCAIVGWLILLFILSGASAILMHSSTDYPIFLPNQ
ncbi:MAG: hypothetical protein DWQ19_12255 [Crenarchaeota archaeon]|nr:MAG: hypothetical protein DWQ19_12255 [Thermoproteota archaeon]